MHASWGPETGPLGGLATPQRVRAKRPDGKAAAGPTTRAAAQVARTLVQSYVRVRLSRVAEVLHCGEAEAERLLASMLLDGQLSGSLDQERGVLELAGPEPESAARATALQAWADQLTAMQSALAARLVVA